MREWLLALVPIVITIYFLIYPAQFTVVIHWIMSLAR
jgi:hypothetical protein